MKYLGLLFCVLLSAPLLACGPSGPAPATTVTPGCPKTPEPYGTCTQEGQVCTWTTGSSAVTYTCKTYMDCSPMTYVVWTDPVVKGDGCAGSGDCTPCSGASEGDACDALGFACAYTDSTPMFPPSVGLLCTDHAWSTVPACEN